MRSRGHHFLENQAKCTYMDGLARKSGRPQANKKGHHHFRPFLFVKNQCTYVSATFCVSLFSIELLSSSSSSSSIMFMAIWVGFSIRCCFPWGHLTSFCTPHVLFNSCHSTIPCRHFIISLLYVGCCFLIIFPLSIIQ